MKNLIVEVNGISMRPYLKTGDRLLINKNQKPRIGDLVYFQSPQLGQAIHRYIGDNKIKGDRVKHYDSSREREIIGVAIARIYQENDQVLQSPLASNPFAYFLAWLQAQVSKFNKRSYFDFIFVAIIASNGLLMRKLESLAARPFQRSQY